MCKLIWGKMEPGPWHMGRYSFWVNTWACIWTLFVSIIFILPTFRPVTGQNMNYAIAFLGLVFLAAYVYWFISGKKFYTGPLTETQFVEGESREKENGAESPSERGEKEKIRDEIVR
jgi:hypothetical protein